MRAALLLAILVISAGCLGGADTNPKNDPRPTPDPDPVPSPVTPPAPTTPRVILLSDFSFTGCSGIEAQFMVSPSSAQALLPANFTIRSDQGPAADQAMARYRILSCPAFSATNSAINETVYGDVALFIDDPNIEESGEGNWYRLRIFATDDVLSLAWQIAGYDVLTGDISLATTPLTQRTLSFEGYEAEWLDTLDDGVLEEEVSFTATDAGVVVWGEVVDEVTPVKLGIGSFSVPSSDPLSGLLSDDPTKVRLLSHSNTNIGEAQLVLIRST